MKEEKPVTDYRIARFQSDRIYRNQDLGKIAYNIITEGMAGLGEKVAGFRNILLNGETMFHNDVIAKYFAEYLLLGMKPFWSEWSQSTSWKFLNGVRSNLKTIIDSMSLISGYHQATETPQYQKELRDYCEEFIHLRLKELEEIKMKFLKENNLANKLISDDDLESLRLLLVDEIVSILADCMVDAITPSLAHDVSIKYATLFFNEVDTRRYVLHKEFFKEFTTVDISKVREDALPRRMSGVVKLPVSVCIRDDPEKNIKTCIDEFNFECYQSSKTGHQIVVTQAIVYERSESSNFGETIVDIFESLTGFKEGAVIQDGLDFKRDLVIPADRLDDELTVNKTREVYGDDWVLAMSRLEKLFVSIIIYLNTGQPDIRSFKNTIRYNKKQKGKKYKKTIKKEDLMLCPYKIFLVGYGWKKGGRLFKSESSYELKSWPKRGGWVNQPFGKGRAERRWQYRSGTTVKRNPDLLKKRSKIIPT